MTLRDSGGLFAKYGPGTQDARRRDGKWIRVWFDRPISFKRAKAFAEAAARGADTSKARVRIAEVPPPYQVPGLDLNSPPWHPISGAPVGEMVPGERYEAKVALPNGATTHGTYRESWLGEWHWFDPLRRKIKPTHFAVIAPPPPRG